MIKRLSIVTAFYIYKILVYNHLEFWFEVETMKFFVGSVIFFLILSFYSYRYFIAGINSPLNNGKVRDLKLDRLKIVFFFFIGFILRVFISLYNSSKGYNGFPTDISCFTAWSRMAFNDGINNFYTSEMYTDYPPGFVYIFYVLGAFAKLFNLSDSSSLFIVLIKMPAMLSDVGIAVVAYLLARDRKVNQIASLFMSLAILLNPLILLDSTIWGQTDSVFVFLLVVSFYLIYKKKNIPAYFVYGISILVKPQSLIFAPVVIFAYVNAIIDARKDKKNFVNQVLIHTGSGVGAVIVTLLLMLPFNIQAALKQYTDTLNSYPYGSVNAYNLWGLLGKCWIGQDEPVLGIPMRTWGTIAIVLIVAASVFIFVKMRESESVYFFIAAFIITAMFTLSVRMHERYIFPAAIFFLFAFILRPRIITFCLFVSSSIVAFFNAYHVLYYYDPSNYDFGNPVMKTIAVFELAVFAVLIVATKKYYIKAENKQDEEAVIAELIKKNNEFFDRIKKSKTEFKFSQPISKMKKIDYIIVSIIMVIYSCLAFYHLGDMDAPSTEYSLVNEGAVTVDLGDVYTIKEMWTYLGHEFDQNYVVNFSRDNETWYMLFTEDDPWIGGSVYNWNKTDVSIEARYIYIEPINKSREDSVIEFVFRDQDGNIVTPVNAEQYHNLFDEQDYAITQDTYMSGTYFDEVHYTRHIYEMKNGLYTYENTHPQLGKEIMAIGTFIFGMNPFGWRFSGTVCGIIMIFAMYVFAKKFFDDTKLATLTTVVFSADFMHFVQSRIATIDVYAVMFIMLSFIFIYEYCQLNFYDTPLRKTYRPLFLCGLFAGFAIASKWIGVYSAAGIAVLIFVQFAYRYREYSMALHRFEGEMTGGSDFDIVKVFNRRLLKTIGWCVLVFIVIPLIFYTLTYIPFNDGVEGRGLIEKMIEAQKTMFNYHTNMRETHSYSSEWYQWPVMVKPILYVLEPVTETTRRDICLLGNPAIWWLGIPASLYMIYLWFNERDRKAGFLMVGYLAQFLPWILVERYTFIYHYFASVPFVTVICMYALVKIGKRYPKLKNAVYVYAIVALLLFILYLPILNGSEVTIEYINNFLKWSSKWAM